MCIVDIVDFAILKELCNNNANLGVQGIVRGGYCLFAGFPISALFANPDRCFPVESLRTELQKDI